jgi:acetylornithine/succinyldiaminopimelate/putrescine aminotransferase
VFDEVQCGFGRTGKVGMSLHIGGPRLISSLVQMFYSEYSGVVPDIQIMAKGIAGM